MSTNQSSWLHFVQILHYTMSSFSFFLVQQAGCARHATDRMHDWRRETGETSWVLPSFLAFCSFAHALPALNLKKKRDCSQSNFTSSAWNFCPEGADASPGETSQAARSDEKQLFLRLRICIILCTIARDCWFFILNPFDKTNLLHPSKHLDFQSGLLFLEYQWQLAEALFVF